MVSDGTFPNYVDVLFINKEFWQSYITYTREPTPHIADSSSGNTILYCIINNYFDKIIWFEKKTIRIINIIKIIMKNNDNDNEYMIKWYEMNCVYIYMRNWFGNWIPNGCEVSHTFPSKILKYPLE